MSTLELFTRLEHVKRVVRETDARHRAPPPIGVAAWSWRHGIFWRGAAWPLVLVALLQIGVGA